MGLAPAPGRIKTGLGSARGREVFRGRESRQGRPGFFATFTGERLCIALFFNMDMRRRKKFPQFGGGDLYTDGGKTGEFSPQKRRRPCRSGLCLYNYLKFKEFLKLIKIYQFC